MIQKRITRELLFAVITITILILIYFTFSMISNKKRANLETINTKNELLVKKIEDIEPLQKLWYELKVIKRFNGDYKDFLMKYGNIKKSEILFNLAKNNNIYEKNLDDFNVEYYRQESALKYLYEMKNFKNLDFKIFYDSIMTNENFTNKSYELFVLDGYSGSLTDFIELMREERKNDKSLTYSSINKIETEIETNITKQEKIKGSIFYSNSSNLIKSLLWILGITFGLRIIIFILKWSFKQKTNANNV